MGGVPGPAGGGGGAVGGGLGFGKIGDSYYARLNLGFELNLGQIGIGVQAPLNLLVYDGSSGALKDRDRAIGGALRREDWDEVGDYFKIIRYVRWGHKREPLYVVVGELRGESLGHGTILGRYMNNLYVDHWKTGLVADVNTKWFGVETLFDNLVSDGDADKNFGGESFGLVAGRAYARPLAGSSIPIVNRAAIGVSAAVDRRAPTRLQLQPTGSGYAIDSKNNFVRDPQGLLTTEQATKVIGVDVEVPVLETSILNIVPYTDVNKIVDAGAGLHVGTMVGFRFPLLIDMGLEGRLEYRVLAQDYFPVYFDTLYDLQRYTYPLALPPAPCNAAPVNGYFSAAQEACLVPKFTALKNQAAGVRQGIYGEVAFNLMSLLTIGGTLEDYTGPNNSSLALFASVPALKVIQFSGFYLRRAFQGFSDAFELDPKSLLGASARIKLMDPGIYFVASFTRQWAQDQTSGEVKSVDNWNTGIEASFSF
jgi:hypothetical protein